MARPPRRPPFGDGDDEDARGDDPGRDLDAIFGERPAPSAPEDSEPRAIDVARQEGAPLLDPCSRWEREQRAVPSLPMWVQATMPSHLEPEAWGAGFLAVHEREIPMQLQADLRENVPQASLRDLFRPVRQFQVTPEVVEGTETIGRWKAAAAEVKEAQRRDARPVVVPATEWVREAQAVRRGIVDGDWKAHLADDAPRRHPQLYLGDEGGGEDE